MLNEVNWHLYSLLFLCVGNVVCVHTLVSLFNTNVTVMDGAVPAVAGILELDLEAFEAGEIDLPCDQELCDHILNGYH